MNAHTLPRPDSGTDPGANVVAMPDLEGKSEDEAKAELTKFQFTAFSAGEAEVTDDCGDKPVVVGQTPAPNTQVPLDQQVTYTMCRAPDKTQVPDNLKGVPQEAAKTAL